jgi:hypothetical protein
MRSLYFLFSMLLSTAVFAQVPQGLNYQGIARNQNGSILAAQPIGVRFSILNKSTSGTLLFQETQQATTNNFGLFTLAIGKGSPVTGDFSAINWGTDSKFLKVEISLQGAANFQLQGTTQLLSVPYALYAEKSGTTGAQGPAGLNGLSILNGINNPSITAGVNGEFYINTTTNQLFGPKTSGSWGTGINLVGATGATGPVGAVGATGTQGSIGLPGATGAQGPVGPKGSGILNGTINPLTTIGVNGDFYINTSSNQLFGPKTSGLWGTGVALIGPAGLQGTQGLNGKTILNGTINPASGIGLDGDFYINTSSTQLFGPKTGGSWGTGVNLIGMGTPGLKSLIDLENFVSSLTCPLGGVTVKSGIDQNSNNILDPNEVDNTKDICFTQNVGLDKLIILPLTRVYTGTDSTNPVIQPYGAVVRFNKLNYPGVDSITFIANPAVNDNGNFAIVTLYNLTDNLPINNSSIKSTHVSAIDPMSPYFETGNIYNFLPNHTVTLAITLQSGIQGSFCESGYAAIYLYRR